MLEKEAPLEVDNTALPESDGAEEAVEQSNEEEQVQEQPVNNEVEGRARKQGWKPKEEYGGDPKYWVDADAYVERAENELPVAKGTIRKLENQIDELQGSFSKMKKFSELQIQRAKEDALEKLRSKQAKAIDEDGINPAEAFNRYEIDKQNIEKQYNVEPESQTKQPQQVPYEVQEWIGRNPWAQAQDAIGYAARGYELEVGNANPHFTPMQVLEEVKRRVMTDFPNRFNNPKRKASPIEGGGTVHAPATKQGTKFSQLPYDVQKDAEKLIRAGDYKSKAEFMKDYELYYKGE